MSKIYFNGQAYDVVNVVAGLDERGHKGISEFTFNTGSASLSDALCGEFYKNKPIPFALNHNGKTYIVAKGYIRSWNSWVAGAGERDVCFNMTYTYEIEVEPKDIVTLDWTVSK